MCSETLFSERFPNIINFLDPSLIEEVQPGQGDSNCAISRPQGVEKWKMKLEIAGLPLFLLSEGKFHETETSIELLQSLSGRRSVIQTLSP